MIDAYQKLFDYYPKEKFFTDSISNIIFVPEDKIEENWIAQRKKLLNAGEFYIRGYGRDAAGTKAFIELYKHLFPGINVSKDQTNNAIPTRLLSDYTGYSKVASEKTDGKKRIQNYQVSHLFGRTKNPILFTTAWNFAYVPKYLDPFTGHETQGKYQEEFKRIFQDFLWTKFEKYILEYNALIEPIMAERFSNAFEITRESLKEVNSEFDDEFLNRFEKDAKSELAVIKKMSEFE